MMTDVAKDTKAKTPDVTPPPDLAPTVDPKLWCSTWPGTAGAG